MKKKTNMTNMLTKMQVDLHLEEVNNRTNNTATRLFSFAENSGSKARKKASKIFLKRKTICQEELWRNTKR